MQVTGLVVGSLPLVFTIFVVISVAFARNHLAYMREQREFNNDVLRRLNEHGRDLRQRIDTLERELAFQRDRNLVLEKTVGAPLPLKVEPCGDANCPYCHSEIAADASVTHCLACGTEHHQECHSGHGGCSVFGCGSRASATGARGQIASLS